MPSRHATPPDDPGVITATAKVGITRTESAHWLDVKVARRFAVEVAASNALDKLPEGFEPVSVRITARRKR